MLKESVEEHSFTIQHVPELMKLLKGNDVSIIYDIILAEIRDIKKNLQGVNNK